ncbi:glycosyltransferase family protein [Candidatus Falkowbacteria bacterium]|nr:glycosyltransferase family protein [Candidatus Falkowbacteria bacterium]
MITAIIQARTGSSRLPEKVLKEVCGKTLLEHQILRVKRAKLLDRIIVATTDKPADDPIAEIAKKTGVDIFRGSEADVLDRYYKAAKKYNASEIVRLTGDCPLIDPVIIDLVIDYYLKNKNLYDYASNVRPPTFPDGLDVEVFSMATLEKAWQEAKLPSEREHVTAYIGKNPEIFRLGIVENAKDLSYLRMTIDEPADWELISKIFLDLYPSKPDFDLADILTLFGRQTELLKLNSDITRNHGYLKSLAKDIKKN